jgi:hypothetical protein
MERGRAPGAASPAPAPPGPPPALSGTARATAGAQKGGGQCWDAWTARARQQGLAKEFKQVSLPHGQQRGRHSRVGPSPQKYGLLTPG